MKKYSLLSLVFLSTCILLTTSCSKDDSHKDPAGTIAFNMLNEANGKTFLGNTDVYIDGADNFYSRDYCLLASLGKRKGLGSLSAPMLQGVSNKVAVEPEHAYQIFKDDAIREFPSGKLAIACTADYYNVYVVAPFFRNDTASGYKVKFVLMDVPDHNLPAYNSSIGTFDYGYGYEPLIINLPTADFEYETSYSDNQITFEQKGKQLIVQLTWRKKTEKFYIYIRVGESYTAVYGEVM